MLKHPRPEPKAALFQNCTEPVIAAMQADPLYLEAIFSLNANNRQQVRVTLTSQFLALTEEGWFDRPFHYYAPLEFQLKFQAIREGELGRAIGFRLLKEGTASVELTVIGEERAELWLKEMGGLMNQLGFHRFFKPVKKLGKGGFATVYEVQRLTDGLHFAVKAFSKQNTLLSNNPTHRLTILNEINIMRAVRSSHVMRLQAVYESDNSIYMVLELLSAGQMHSLINRRQGRFSHDEIRQFMSGLARGMADLHARGIMHRDLKPENIMLRREDSLDPVIVDFGLSAFANAEDYILYRCGTPGYVAPEITTLVKGQRVSPVCDVFSAGAIFHILLVRRPLFQGRKFEELYQNNRRLKFDLNSNLYRDVDPVAMDLLRRMLKADPRERISAQEVLGHPFLQGWVMEEEKEPAPARTILSSRTTNQ